MSFIDIKYPNAGDAISKTTFADAVIDNLKYLKGAIEEADVVLPNPSFEGYTTETLADETMIDRPNNWALGDPQVLNGEYQATTEDAHHGSRSLKLTGNPNNSLTAGDRTELYSDFFKVEESESYTVRWAEKRMPLANAGGLSTDAQVFMEFYSSADPSATMLRSIELTAGATDSVGESFVRRTPKEVTTNNLEYFARFLIKGPTNDGAAFFDDFRMALAGEFTTQTLNATDGTFNTVKVNGASGETSVEVVGDVDASKKLIARETVEAPSIVAGGGAAQTGKAFTLNGNGAVTGHLKVDNGLEVKGNASFDASTFSVTPSGAGLSSFLHYHNHYVENYNKRIQNYKTEFTWVFPFFRNVLVNGYDKLAEIAPGQGTYLVFASAQYYKKDDNAGAYLTLAVDGSVDTTWVSHGPLTTNVTSLNLHNFGILTIGANSKIQAYGRLDSSQYTYARVDTRMWLLKVGN